MNIREIHENKKQFLPLLLLADEQEDMIDRYLERGTMYVLEDGGVKAECVVTDEGGGILELKNLAVEPETQRKGYGKALIDFLVRQYAGCYALLQVGTGDSPLTVPFYEKCGFVRSHRIPNFFTDHYDHPIYEAGVQLVDMVYLQRKLCHPACKPRCRWCSLANPLYVRYHDEEWGVPCHDDHALYELLILESFQAGLSWETVLNKRQRFREVYDGFDLDKVCAFGEEKIAQLLSDEGIIRNRRKIRASIQNSRIFRDIQEEYGSFDAYIWSWTEGKILYENDPAITTGPLSDAISQDLKKRGMTFVGSTIIYAYLQAIGVINAHSDDCWLHTSSV